MGPGGFFPTNPDPADILGRTDVEFENFSFFYFVDPTFLHFQVPRFPKAGPGLGLGGKDGGGGEMLASQCLVDDQKL